MHIVNAKQVLYHLKVLKWGGTIDVTLLKIKYKNSLEVENYNNPVEKQHIKDTSSGERGKRYIHVLHSCS